LDNVFTVTDATDTDECMFGRRCEEAEDDDEDRNTQWWLPL